MAGTYDATTGGYNDTVKSDPVPGSGSFAPTQAQLEGAYSSALNQINDKRTSFLRQQGLIGNYDAQTGNFIGTSVDGNNQGGAYQQMANANAGQGAADEAAINSMGFGGGLQAQQQEAAQRSYSQNATNWALNANAGLGDLSQQGVDALGTESSGLYNGLVDNIQAAITNGVFNPADYSNVTLGTYGSMDQNDLTTLATGLGWKPDSIGGSSGSTGGTGTGTLGGTAGGGNTLGRYAAYRQAGGTMTRQQWHNHGRPTH